jgi:hypothetical protein
MATKNRSDRVGRGKNSGTGAFAGTQHGGENDGVTSAKPQVVTGREDASFKTEAETVPTKDAGKDI